MTAPVSTKPPKTLPEWIDYLHSAAAVPKGSPDYPDAREAVQYALLKIRGFARSANAQDQIAAAQNDAASAPAFSLGLAHGLSLGAGEPIAGLIDLLKGGSFGEGAAQYREGLSNIGAAHPTATPLGDVTGNALLAAVPTSSAIEGGTQTAQLIRMGRANMLARFLTGASQTDIAPGLALGGIAGFSAGGEDPGDIKARLTRGAVGAAGGAATQAVLGGLGALKVPRWIDRVGLRVQKALGKNASPAEVASVAEAIIRNRLQKEGFSPENIEQLVATWKRGGQPAPIAEPKPVAAPIARPGETLSPIPGNQRGFEVTGTRATPAAPTTPTILEMQTGQRLYPPLPDIGRGKTLPYYPRGGRVEQALGSPPPVTSAVPGPDLAPGQAQAFAEFLKVATDPADALSRLGTLRALGVPNLPADADLLAVLGMHP